MRVTSVDIMKFPSEKPSFANPIPVICRVNTDEGIYGYGEAGTTFFTASGAVADLIKDMGKMIIGKNPLYHEVIWKDLFDNCYWTKSNGPVIIAALSALDTALWDIKGKAYGKPVYELLGGKFHDKLRCYASQLQFGFQECRGLKYTYDDYYEVTAYAKSLGYDAVKTDPMVCGKNRGEISLTKDETFGFFRHDVLGIIDERIRATRDALGPDGDIIIEMHAQTNLQTAAQVAKIVEQYDIMYLEESIEPLVPDAMQALSTMTGIPLTGGERTALRAGFLPYLQQRSYAMIQPDMGICGGMTEMKKICDMAYTYDVGVQAHVCGSPISVAAGVQLEAAIPNFTIHETHGTSLAPDILAMGVYQDFLPENGYITVPDRPGIGQELSDEALSKAVTETVR